MRHSGTYRRWAISNCLIGTLLFVTVVSWWSFAATAETRHAFLSAPAPSIPSIRISGIRFGNHAGLVRLVMDLNDQGLGDQAFRHHLKFAATAMTAQDFLLTVWQAKWQAGQTPVLVTTGATQLALQVIHPGGSGGAARFRISSHRPAYVRRIFLLPPPVHVTPDTDGTSRAVRTTSTRRPKWRLVLDMGIINGAIPNHAADGPTLSLPAMHGMAPPKAMPHPPTMPVNKDTAPIIISADIADRGQRTLPVAPVGTSAINAWAHASQLLQELRAHAAPNLSGPIKPQLVLPAKYRSTLIPLR